VLVKFSTIEWKQPIVSQNQSIDLWKQSIVSQNQSIDLHSSKINRLISLGHKICYKQTGSADCENDFLHFSKCERKLDIFACESLE